MSPGLYTVAVEPAVFLDRDNTLIHNDGDLGDPDAVKLKDGVAEGLKALRQAGYRLVVVTNQGGVARGRYSEADVDSVNQRIACEVETLTKQRPTIDRFYYCPYHPEGTVEEYRRDHPWRKPHPGMLLQAARDMNLDLATSWLIGDQSRDVQAGQAAGCRTIMIATGESAAGDYEPTAAVNDFAAAVKYVLNQASKAPVVNSTPPTNGVTTAKSEPKSARKASKKQGGGVATIATPVVAPKTKTKTVEVPVEIAVDTEVDKPVADMEPAPPTPAPAPVSNDEVTLPAPTKRAVTNNTDSTEMLRRAVVELNEELQTHRQKKAEFTPIKMVAGGFQLIALLMVVLGLLQISNTDALLSWISFAILMQLFTITLLLFQRH